MKSCRPVSQTDYVFDDDAPAFYLEPLNLSWILKKKIHSKKLLSQDQEMIFFFPPPPSPLFISPEPLKLPSRAGPITVCTTPPTRVIDIHVCGCGLFMHRGSVAFLQAGRHYRQVPALLHGETQHSAAVCRRRLRGGDFAIPLRDKEKKKKTRQSIHRGLTLFLLFFPSRAHVPLRRGA